MHCISGLKATETQSFKNMHLNSSNTRDIYEINNAFHLGSECPPFLLDLVTHRYAVVVVLIVMQLHCR